MRKMATIRKIDSVEPIIDAEKIELAKIGGWQVVVEKNKYAVDQKVIFCEIDSWIPHEIAPFLSKGTEPKTYNNIRGNRLRTVRLRGVLSQGLVLPLTDFENLQHVQVGEDVSSQLNIVKYEPPVPAQLGGVAKGLFPAHTPKTDQERVQNILKEFTLYQETGKIFEVTEKLEGSSMTVCVLDGKIEVCSRNLSLVEDPSNTFWKVAKQDRLIEKLQQLNKNISLQGELVGEGIQGNIYKIKGHAFYLYNIWDIDRQRHLTPNERIALCGNLQINHVPIISNIALKDTSVTELLSFADGQSALNSNQRREGLVFKCTDDGATTFKVISNAYLEKQKC